LLHCYWRPARPALARAPLPAGQGRSRRPECESRRADEAQRACALRDVGPDSSNGGGSPRALGARGLCRRSAVWKVLQRRSLNDVRALALENLAPPQNARPLPAPASLEDSHRRLRNLDRPPVTRSGRNPCSALRGSCSGKWRHEWRASADKHGAVRSQGHLLQIPCGCRSVSSPMAVSDGWVLVPQKLEEVALVTPYPSRRLGSRTP
jgi:hypothetical protein